MFIKYKVLNACEYGNIPQNRERIYVVGFKNKEQFDKFAFPEKIPLTKTIHDILDKEKQDNKYYYANSKMIDLLKKEITDKNSIYQYRSFLFQGFPKDFVLPKIFQQIF